MMAWAGVLLVVVGVDGVAVLWMGRVVGMGWLELEGGGCVGVGGVVYEWLFLTLSGSPCDSDTH